MNVDPDKRFHGEHIDPNPGMPPRMELPNKEQELIRAIQRENSNSESCARELVEEYNWGPAKAERVLRNARSQSG